MQYVNLMQTPTADVSYNYLYSLLASLQIAKMQLEASQADSENDRIHTEFSLREAKTESLIRQQQVN